MKRRGSGLKKIIQSCEFEKNYTEDLKPDDRREDIIEIIEGISQVTVFDLSKIFYVSERTIERDLKKITDEKVIEYIGSAKDGYWRVKK